MQSLTMKIIAILLLTCLVAVYACKLQFLINMLFIWKKDVYNVISVCVLFLHPIYRASMQPEPEDNRLQKHRWRKWQEVLVLFQKQEQVCQSERQGQKVRPWRQRLCHQPGMQKELRWVYTIWLNMHYMKLLNAD